jgi:7-keto-8-aminopelargonate synthetase-like enzyme
MLLNGRRMLVMCQDDYLCLSNHKKVIQASVAAIRRYGTGCSGSRFLNGTLDIHQLLETRLAEFLNQPGALVFPSSYLANVGTVAALLGRRDLALVDELAHPGLHDGCRLSFGAVRRFQHNDMGHLEQLLRAHAGKRILVMVEGVSGLLGDSVDLPWAAALCRRRKAGLLVSDTHGIGVLGERGGGTSLLFGVTSEPGLTVAGFGTLGGSGGCLAGDADVIEYVKHHARSLIFSASLAPSAAAATLAAIDVIQQEPWRREALWRNTRKLRDGCRNLGYSVFPGTAPIVTIALDSPSSLRTLWRELFDRGVLARSILTGDMVPPIPLLRMSCTSDHTSKHVDYALEALRQAKARLDKHGLG